MEVYATWHVGLLEAARATLDARLRPRVPNSRLGPDAVARPRKTGLGGQFDGSGSHQHEPRGKSLMGRVSCPFYSAVVGALESSGIPWRDGRRPIPSIAASKQDDDSLKGEQPWRSQAAWPGALSPHATIGCVIAIAGAGCDACIRDNKAGYRSRHSGCNYCRPSHSLHI